MRTLINKFRKLTKKKKIIVIVVCVAVIGFLFVSLFGSAKKPNYVFGNVERGDVTEYVTENGIISTTGAISITSSTTGIVTEVYVKNGDIVKTGDKLFALKSSATEQEKSQALANYLAAKSTLDAANSGLLKLQAVMFDKWDSFRELATSDMYETSDGKAKDENRALPEFHISQDQWLAAEADYKQQQTVINQAKAAVSSTYLLYAATQDSVVKAVADGMVRNIAVAAQNAVSATSARPLAVIDSSAFTEAEVALNEYAIAKVAEGQSVTVDVKAITDKSYHGYITRVDSIGTDVKGVMRYYAYVQIGDADNSIRPGMSADITITTKKHSNVLTVPNAAVKPNKGGRAVRIIGKAGAVEYLPVLVGIRGKTKTEIRKGLSENQQIIISLPNDQIKRSGLF